MSKSRAQIVAEKLANVDLIEDATGHEMDQAVIKRDVMNDTMDNLSHVAQMFQKMALECTEKATRYITAKHNLQNQILCSVSDEALEFSIKNDELTEQVKELEQINESSKELIKEVAEENNTLGNKVDSLEEKVGDLEDKLTAKDEQLKAKDEELKKLKALWQKLQAEVDEMKKEPQGWTSDDEIFGNRYKVINKALGKMDPKDLETITDQKKPTNVFSSKSNDQQQSSPKKLKKAKKKAKSH